MTTPPTRIKIKIKILRRSRPAITSNRPEPWPSAVANTADVFATGCQLGLTDKTIRAQDLRSTAAVTSFRASRKTASNDWSPSILSQRPERYAARKYSFAAAW